MGRHRELTGFDLIQLRVFQGLLTALFILTSFRYLAEEWHRFLDEVRPPGISATTPKQRDPRYRGQGQNESCALGPGVESLSVPRKPSN